jgi:hypothetical protein
VIRPVTCICFALACGSGLYLYQAKHRVNLLDGQIRQTVRATDAAREQIRLLHAEWTRLSQPDRLQTLADQFLNLKTTSPSQFTSIAQLDDRLPPVRARQPEPAPAAAPPKEMPVASASPTPLPPAPVAAAAPPPKPAEVATPAEHPRAAPAPSVVASASRPVPPVVRVHPAVIEAADRPPWPPRRPTPIAAVAPPPQPVATSGSLLGMAHAVAAPAPQPVPLNPHWGPNGN